MSWNSWALAVGLVAALVANGACADEEGARDQAINAATPDRWAALSKAAGVPPQLHEAVLGGAAHVGTREGHAAIVVGCRSDAKTRWVLLRVPEDGLGFPIDQFEGPGGAGESVRRVRIKLGKTVRSVYVSGSFQTGGFEFQWTPSVADLRNVGTAAQLQVEVTDPGRTSGPLIADFRGPAERGDLEALLSACRLKP